MRLFAAPTAKCAASETMAAATTAGTPWRKKNGTTGMRAPTAVESAPDVAETMGLESASSDVPRRSLASARSNCSESLAIMQDLPVGVDPEGADAWAWQGVLAEGVTFGAPPDPFAAGGQDWGLPPFIPHQLRAACYEPFIQTIRAVLRHAGALRVDHVMGLFRLFWIPKGAPAAEGAYVRYPVDDLLGILALESHRAKAIVVGEDLGTVESGVREKLAACNVLSSRVLWFESDPPARYPRRAMASITTHDLPTIAGLWTGSDVRAQQQAGLQRMMRRVGMPGSDYLRLSECAAIGTHFGEQRFRSALAAAIRRSRLETDRVWSDGLAWCSDFKASRIRTRLYGTASSMPPPTSADKAHLIVSAILSEVAARIMPSVRQRISG